MCKSRRANRGYRLEHAVLCVTGQVRKQVEESTHHKEITSVELNKKTKHKGFTMTDDHVTGWELGRLKGECSNSANCWQVYEQHCSLQHRLPLLWLNAGEAAVRLFVYPGLFFFFFQRTNFISHWTAETICQLFVINVFFNKQMVKQYTFHSTLSVSEVIPKQSVNSKS